MRNMVFYCLVLILIPLQSVFAISERHLILIRHGHAAHNQLGTFNSNPRHERYVPSHLTETGVQQAKNTAERLVLHGFDNRNIAAVYVSPLPRTVETAELIAEFGVFTKDKIIQDNRLIEAQAGELEGAVTADFVKDAWHVSEADTQEHQLESNQHVRGRMMSLYDDVIRKHPQGHIIFITHGMPAMELLQEVVQVEVRLNNAEAYLLPLISRA